MQCENPQANGLECFIHHSIFADDRNEEREKTFKCMDSMLILAWGGNSKIRKLANDALARLPKERKIFGLPGTKKWSFRHPFPMLQAKCEVWLKDMVEQLNNSDSKSQITATKECNK
ncbi:hypothetical protein J2S74_005292 [Evansella vedderi]|uniref:Uncharacterized protein n=1 Tax=Evansella vedderi TaxID=38282 RepID=A0ABU0A400_9BACI|nr:hypothetical protein [Evansella vedderi]MDQ0257829.1 hypothetical protein [Evansella vedderi]